MHFIKSTPSILTIALTLVGIKPAIGTENLHNFDHFEFGYIELELGHVETQRTYETIETKGIYLDGRYSFVENWYLSYGALHTEEGVSYDFAEIRQDTINQIVNERDYRFDQQHLGFGYVYSHSNVLRFTADLNYLRRKIILDSNNFTTQIDNSVNSTNSTQKETFTYNGTLNGVLVRAGMEYAITDKFQINSELFYDHTKGGGFTRNDVGMELGINYKLSDRWSISSSLKLADDDGIKVGALYSF